MLIVKNTKVLKWIVMAVVAVVMTSCENDNYYIRGKIFDKTLTDGDTLFLTFDLNEGLPADTATTKGRWFNMHGKVDTARVAMIYRASNMEDNVVLFLEPGIITIKMYCSSGSSRVKGTPLNDEWQAFTDTINRYSRQINRLLELPITANTSSLPQDSMTSDVKKIYLSIQDCVSRTRQRNANNPIGKFLERVDVRNELVK